MCDRWYATHVYFLKGNVIYQSNFFLSHFNVVIQFSQLCTALSFLKCKNLTSDEAEVHVVFDISNRIKVLSRGLTKHHTIKT
jgi:hypothetical protein